MVAKVRGRFTDVTGSISIADRLSDSAALSFAAAPPEVVPGLVELEVAVPHLRLAEW